PRRTAARAAVPRPVLARHPSAGAGSADGDEGPGRETTGPRRPGRPARRDRFRRAARPRPGGARRRGAAAPRAEETRNPNPEIRNEDGDASFGFRISDFGFGNARPA